MRILRAIAVLAAAASLSAPVWASADLIKECENDCRTETTTCEDMCEEYAGAGAGKCQEACVQTEKECIDECHKGYD